MQQGIQLVSTESVIKRSGMVNSYNIQLSDRIVSQTDRPCQALHLVATEQVDWRKILE